MKTTPEFKPGSLVRMHNRDWVVLASDHEDLLRLKPLGGSEAEIKGVYKPLIEEVERIESTQFPLPTADDLGDFSSAKVLYDATRLSFRNGAGPFRSMGKLSFRPRSYQLVPLLMALRMETVRLLIADDVGIGKTIEALMIVRELLDRAEIKRFAVICLPHLCDQWSEELKSKFGLEATVIRSSTVRALERQLGPDENIFQRHPYQVISIDYIKTGAKRELFLTQCPEFVVVDEAHTCAQPSGGKKNQQLRHRLIRTLAENPKQHLLLLSATPHSGKSEEFQSILGLLHADFQNLDLSAASPAEKKAVARHFVQRRRKNLEKYMEEKTPFPERQSTEVAYSLSEAYQKVFRDVLKVAYELAAQGKEDEHVGTQHIRHYLAINLMRGVMSSPAMGEFMLRQRLDKLQESAPKEEKVFSDEALWDDDFGQQDQGVPAISSAGVINLAEQERLIRLAEEVSALRGFKHDLKAHRACKLLEEWLPTDDVIVFCRYVSTANYLGELLTEALNKTFANRVALAVITSELGDVERRQAVRDLMDSDRRYKVIVATDCMSEGINLQEAFSAVLHYDLPWNPNRLEQREGRVDRFGQEKPIVKASLLYGKDNPMDGTVLKVLLRKATSIRQAIGISVPLPDDSKTVMEAVLTAVLLQPPKEELVQGSLDFGDNEAVQAAEIKVEKSFARIKEREKQITSVFAQNSIRPGELAPYLQESDLALGNAETLERLLSFILPHMGAAMKRTEHGYRLTTTNLPAALKEHLDDSEEVLLSFRTPITRGYQYIGRNHAFVEQLCALLMYQSVSQTEHFRLARAAVFRSTEVAERTTYFLLRVRNVIARKEEGSELVAEEMLLVKLVGLAEQHGAHLAPVADTHVLTTLKAEVQLPREAQEAQLEQALADFAHLQADRNRLAEDRAAHMLQGHKHFRKMVAEESFQQVEPVLPPDVMGVYVVLPTISNLC